MGPWETFYHGPYQHPLLLWACAGAAGAYALTRRDLAPSLRRYCRALLGLSLLDAWLTADTVQGLGPLPAALAGAVPLFFVLAGDFRYWLLLACARPGGSVALEARPALAAAAVTLVVPLFSRAAMAALGEPPGGARVLFLVYELAFAALVLAQLRWNPARAPGWTRPVSRCVLLYYALWAGADALLLASGWDAGFALRVVPNALYYGGLIAVIGWAGASARESDQQMRGSSSP